MGDTDYRRLLELREEDVKRLVREGNLLEQVVNEARIYKAAMFEALGMEHNDKEAFGRKLKEAANAQLVMFDALARLDGEHAALRTEEAKARRKDLAA